MSGNVRPIIKIVFGILLIFIGLGYAPLTIHRFGMAFLPSGEYMEMSSWPVIIASCIGAIPVVYMCASLPFSQKLRMRKVRRAAVIIVLPILCGYYAYYFAIGTIPMVLTATTGYAYWPKQEIILTLYGHSDEQNCPNPSRFEWSLGKTDIICDLDINEPLKIKPGVITLDRWREGSFGTLYFYERH